MCIFLWADLNRKWTRKKINAMATDRGLGNDSTEAIWNHCKRAVNVPLAGFRTFKAFVVHRPDASS